MAKFVHLFIDESGNSGCDLDHIKEKKVTPHFLVGSAFFPFDQYKECKNKLKSILDSNQKRDLDGLEGD